MEKQMVKIFHDLDFRSTYIRYDLTEVRPAVVYKQCIAKKKEKFCTKTHTVMALAPCLSKRAGEQNSRMCYIFRGGTFSKKYFSSQSQTAAERYIFQPTQNVRKAKKLSRKKKRKIIIFK